MSFLKSIRKHIWLISYKKKTIDDWGIAFYGLELKDKAHCLLCQANSNENGILCELECKCPCKENECLKNR